MTYTEEIINYIKKNRVSTTEVADALDKKGHFKNVYPINYASNFHKVGKIKCVFTAFKSNYDLHSQIEEIEEGNIILILTHECGDNAIFGDLISKYLILYKNSNAIIVNGKVRDVSKLIKENYPIWSEGFTPIGCVNKKTKSFPKLKMKKLFNKYDDSIAVCDNGGVVIIEKSKINQNTLDKIKVLESQEDLWYFCLDTLKWSTKKIVCDKKYLKQTENLSNIHKKNLNKLKKPFKA